MLATSLASSIYQTGTGLSCAQNTPLLQTVAIATPQAIEIIQEYNLSRTTTISELSEAQSELSVLSALLPTTSRVSSPRSCMFVSQIYVCSCACCSSPSACTKVLWVLTVRKRSLISLLPVQASLPEGYHNPAVCVCVCVLLLLLLLLQRRLSSDSTRQIPIANSKVQYHKANSGTRLQNPIANSKVQCHKANFSTRLQNQIANSKVQCHKANSSTRLQNPIQNSKVQYHKTNSSTRLQNPIAKSKVQYHNESSST